MSPGSTGTRPESPRAGPPPESGGQTPARGESPHYYRPLLSAATKGSGLQAMTCLGGGRNPQEEEEIRASQKTAQGHKHLECVLDGSELQRHDPRAQS